MTDDLTLINPSREVFGCTCNDQRLLFSVTLGYARSLTQIMVGGPISAHRDLYKTPFSGRHKMSAIHQMQAVQSAEWQSMAEMADRAHRAMETSLTRRSSVRP